MPLWCTTHQFQSFIPDRAENIQPCSACWYLCHNTWRSFYCSLRSNYINNQVHPWMQKSWLPWATGSKKYLSWHVFWSISSGKHRFAPKSFCRQNIFLSYNKTLLFQLMLWAHCNPIFKANFLIRKSYIQIIFFFWTHRASATPTLTSQVLH